MKKLAAVTIIFFLVYGCASTSKVNYYQPEVVYQGKCVTAFLGETDLTKKCQDRFSYSVSSDGVDVFRFFFKGMHIQMFGYHTYRFENDSSVTPSRESAKNPQQLDEGNKETEPALIEFYIFKTDRLSREKADYTLGQGTCRWHKSPEKHMLACESMLGEDQVVRIEFKITGKQE